MIIKQIIISAFGGIKDLSIDLSSGMNIIYGKNEAGKSTTQAFIKAMFYGLNSSKQSIRENDRKRYMPWNNDTMKGQLIFEDEKNIEYLIKRSFAQTKKNDTSAVLNAISGVQAKNIDFMSPGDNIFGLGSEAFEKTLFIRQLGCKVSRDNEDEIMTKLSNISQSGDEEISYHKSKEALLQAQKSITNIRKNGKLDMQKRQLSDLIQEKAEVLHLNDEIINDQVELNQHKKQLNIIKTEIDDLEKAKQNFQKTKLFREYTKLKNCMETSGRAKDELHDLEQLLMADEKVIDQKYIDNLKEKYGEYLNDKKTYAQIDSDLKGLTNDLDKLIKQKENYKGFENLEPDIEQKLLNYQNEIKVSEKLQIEINNLKDELKQTQAKLVQEKESLGDLACFENINTETEQKITSKEERLRELELKLQSNAKEDNIKLRYEILKDKKKTAYIITGVGILLTLATFAFGVAALIGIPCLIYGIYSILSINKRLEAALQEMDGFKNTDGTRREYDSLKDELQNIYKSYNVSSYNEYNSKLKRFYESKNSLDVINALIKEKSAKIEALEKEINVEDLGSKRSYIISIFSKCRCEESENFSLKLRAYEKLKIDISNIESNIKSTSERMTEVMSRFSDAEKEILNSLKTLGLESLTIDSIPENIELLSERLIQLKELENNIKSADMLYNSLLQGRSIKEIESQLEGYTSDYNEEIASTAEEFDGLIKEKNAALIDSEKTIANLENSIKTKLTGRRTLDHIEADLENTQEKINYYEKTLKSIEHAQAFLEDSFEEIRKNFGPKLNSKVGDILSRITSGKYQNVKIADDYEVKIEDNRLNMIKELEYFSNGTWDQIYFALRLGIIDLIYGEESSMPIILDDTFVQYDDERLKAVLDYLHTISEQKQVILFTCQQRELEILQNYSDVGVITL